MAARPRIRLRPGWNPPLTDVVLRPKRLTTAVEPLLGSSTSYTNETSNNNSPSADTWSSLPAPLWLWNYASLLFVVLFCWLVYLILPKGCRKAYCGADPRRHRKRPVLASPPAPLVPPADISFPRLTRPSVSPVPVRRSPLAESSDDMDASTITSMDHHPHEDDSHGYRAAPHRPSSHHPAIDETPSPRILDTTLARLQTSGLRLSAHGNASTAKRVWLRYTAERCALDWQTEKPQWIEDQTGQRSQVAIRGAPHAIALDSIVYIEVGKGTSALQRTPPSVQPETCFSLVTARGSLDLQARSALERNAVVCTLARLLDLAQPQSDWRAQYHSHSSEGSSVYPPATNGWTDL